MLSIAHLAPLNAGTVTGIAAISRARSAVIRLAAAHLSPLGTTRQIVIVGSAFGPICSILRNASAPQVNYHVQHRRLFALQLTTVGSLVALMCSQVPQIRTGHRSDSV